MRRFLIFSAFGLLLLALKLSAIAVVDYAGPGIALLIIPACFALACRLDPVTAAHQQQRPERPTAERGLS